MNHSKHKHQKHSKRAKTQPSAYSPFDDSILLLVLSKIHKALHQTAKHKFDSLSLSLTHINKDINAISNDCKHKQNILLLIVHLNIFQLIYLKKYPEALQIIKDNSSNFNHKTHQILKLSILLLQALILKHLQKQEQSKNLVQNAIRNLNLADLKVNPKTSQQKIIESIILSISIIADHFSKFQTQSFGFRQIYTQAYKIAFKYLTQYHKLTQTLFAICRKFPQEKSQLIRKSKKKTLKTINKRKSLNLNQNRYFLKDFTSERSYLNHTIQPKSFSALNDSSDNCSKIRNSQIPKRLRTIDPGIDLRQEKQLCLSKLYGTDLKQVKQKVIFDKKYFKRAKHSSSQRPSAFEPNDAIEMQQLEKISKLYLPKLEAKKKDSRGNQNQKLNAVQVFKFSSTLAKLKPSYFDRLRTEEDYKNIHSQAKHTALAIDFKQARQTNKMESNSTNLQKPFISGSNAFESLPIQINLKEKLLFPLKQPQKLQISNDSQQNCQLI